MSRAFARLLIYLGERLLGPKRAGDRPLVATKERFDHLGPNDAPTIIFQTIIENHYGESTMTRVINVQGTYLEGDNYGTITNNIQTLAAGDTGQRDVAQALDTLLKAVKADDTMPEGQKKKLGGNLKLLSEEAVKPPPERNEGVIESVLAGIGSVAGVAKSVAEAIAVCLPVIAAFFS